MLKLSNVPAVAAAMTKTAVNVGSSFLPGPVSAAGLGNSVMGMGESILNRDQYGNWDPNWSSAGLNAGSGTVDAYNFAKNPTLSFGGPLSAPKAVGGGLRNVGAAGDAVLGASHIANKPLSNIGSVAKAAPVGALGKTMSVLGKVAPFIGGAAGLYDARNRWKNQDYLGSVISGVGGVAGLIPTPHTQALSFGLNAVNAGIDAVGHMRAKTNIQNNANEVSRNIQKNYPELRSAPQPSNGGNVNIQPNSSAANTQPATPPQPVAAQPPQPAAPQPVQPTNTSTQPMKTADENQFRADLANPSAGTDSDLYTTVSPMISSPEDDSLQGAEAARIKALKEQVRKGLVGMEYLTGLKKNTGETFYDEHPVQAVTRDVLKNSVPLGAGIAGAGIGTNLLRQWSNMNMTEPAKMSRSENPKGDATHPANLLDPDKRARPDVSRVFGDYGDNAQKRLEILDRLNKTKPGAKDSFAAKYKKLSKGKANQKKLQQLLTEARNSEGSAALKNYANFHESLQRASEKGGLKNYLGEGLRSLPGGIGEFLGKHVLPGRFEAIGDLAEKHKLTGANPHFDEELLKNIVKEYRGGGNFHSASDPKGSEFVDSVLQKLHDRKHQRSGLGKAFSRAKLPLVAGAATALGGAGLYQLVKAIQDRTHSSDKVRDWKKTLLKSRGEFDAANQVQ